MLVCVLGVALVQVSTVPMVLDPCGLVVTVGCG